MAIPDDNFLNADQEREVAFISGFNADGTLVSPSFQTVNRDQQGNVPSPPTYSTTSGANKWGGTTAGTAGGVVTYQFNSSYTAGQQATVKAALQLWQDEANISFQQVASGGMFDFEANSNKAAFESGYGTGHPVGSTTVSAQTGDGGSHATPYISLDFSNDSMGRPVTGTFNDDYSDNGASFDTAVHEEGHLIGLGHGGPYNDSGDGVGGAQAPNNQFTSYDSQQYDLMSYISAGNASSSNYNAAIDNATPNYSVNRSKTTTNPDGSTSTTNVTASNSPATSQMLDILAAQRIYGAATTGPLTQAQTFGFNCTITDATSVFFDFSKITNPSAQFANIDIAAPVCTIYDSAATGNTLDLSGYSTGSTVNLAPGSFCSVDGLTNNVGIAYGTTISTVVGSTGVSTFTGTSKAEIFTGNASGDTFTGGGGADVYRDKATNLNKDTVTDFSNADTINVTDATGLVYNLAFTGTTLSFSTTPTGTSTTMQLQGGTVTGAPQQKVDAAGGVDIFFSTAVAPTPTPTPAPAPEPSAPASNPTITGTHATADAGEAIVHPFGGSAAGGPVTITDANAGATDSLAITLSGGGGVLAGQNGDLVQTGANSYALAATDPGTLTRELDALTFTPTAGQPGAANPTTFTLVDTSSAGTTATDSGTAVTDTATTPQPTPIPIAPGSSGVVGVTPADAISIAQQVSYDGSAFSITGAVSSAVGVRSVEITAQVNGVATDLGAATVNANGTFNFSDLIGASTQGFITATETDRAGVTASAQANYSLQGGLDTPNMGRAPFVAEQDVYTADGSTTISVSLFRGDGSATNDASRRTTVMALGQTFTSDQFDDFKNSGTPETTFVFNPNHGLDAISLFRVDGVDHDTLSFKGFDFGNSIAEVLNDTHQTAGGSSIITDPNTGDMVKLVGITKQQLAANQGDFTFHA